MCVICVEKELMCERSVEKELMCVRNIEKELICVISVEKELMLEWELIRRRNSQYTAFPFARKSRRFRTDNKYYVKSLNSQISTTY